MLDRQLCNQPTDNCNSSTIHLQSGCSKVWCACCCYITPNLLSKGGMHMMTASSMAASAVTLCIWTVNKGVFAWQHIYIFTGQNKSQVKYMICWYASRHIVKPHVLCHAANCHTMMHDHELKPTCISSQQCKLSASLAGLSTICCMGLLLIDGVQFGQETGPSVCHIMQHAAVRYHRCVCKQQLFVLVKRVCLPPPDSMHMT